MMIRIFSGILLFSTLVFLHFSWGDIPALGKLISPFQGCWQSADSPSLQDETYDFPALKQAVQVKYDEQFTPHIYAQHLQDAIFIQAYLHAKNRLWQMDMTTRLASGRLSEVAGMKTLEIDRNMRRKGMVFAAENSTRAMLQNEKSAPIIRSYTQGVNQFIQELDDHHLPLEYLLMSFKPEPWTPLKTGLMLKFMADKLSGHTQDFELSLARQCFPDYFDDLYPLHLQEEFPVISSSSEKTNVQQVSNSDTRSFSLPKPIHHHQAVHQPAIGSNNWALSGSRTQSGFPILCNDPHLPLNLPAIWYENQIICPEMNVYGVSLPGAPAVVIGFNDSIAWGFTNGYRDVKDFYEVQLNASKSSCRFDQTDIPLRAQVDTIFIKGGKPFLDTLYYAADGILIYDAAFPKEGYEGRSFLMKWMAHRGSNELLALLGLNQAKNYHQYVEAIQSFECPHQNIVFAAASGDIAMWSQGQFIHRQSPQGRFVQERGNLHWNLWPMADNPHERNPERGFVMSANQVNTHRSDPSYYSGIFTEERAKRITNMLSANQKFSVQDMMRFQTDLYHQNAADILPFMLQQVQFYKWSPQQEIYLRQLKQWDYITHPDSVAPIYFSLWFGYLEAFIYDDDFGKYKSQLVYPNERATIELMKRDTLFPLFDLKHTPEREDIRALCMKAFREMCHTADTLQDKKWYQFKNTSATHLSRIPAFGETGIRIGGGHGIVNAASHQDGPSWRMVVHFNQPIEAYSMYHSGQSGNPGSPFYLNKLSDWAKGNYFKIRFMQPQDFQ
ncbi:MAG: penicillin acylase family protein [Bacteroidetes bacterium]|nr:penicillin acylase family protein [Bacteroidota bacterium]